MDQNGYKRRNMFGQLGNNQYNFQLNRFTAIENIANSFREATFLTHTVDVVCGAKSCDNHIGYGAYVRRTQSNTIQ